MKVLLVDDDAFLRDMYATKFEEAGHSVEAAKNGKEALSLLENNVQFDVILMDMVMPGMTGIEFLESAKKFDVAGTTKFVVLSNQGEQADIDDANSAGAAGYIVKAESIPSQVVTKVESLVK